MTYNELTDDWVTNSNSPEVKFMKKIFKLFQVITVGLLGLLCSSTAGHAEMTKAGQEAVVKAGEVMFQHRCRVCHSNDMKHPSYGPPLKNIIGRKAGSVIGFNYSDALKNSGIIWTNENLRKWIKDNKSVMPGTRMRHIGVTDKTEQDFILHYLAHISK